MDISSWTKNMNFESTAPTEPSRPENLTINFVVSPEPPEPHVNNETVHG